LKNFLDQIANEYDTVFLDCNPSFSLYTQIALATTDRVVLPVMADDSSRRAIQNAFSLIYGLKLPSEIYASYAFATKLKAAQRPLPQVHLIAKNRITQYMGSASAYAAVLNAIQNDIQNLLKTNPEIFTFKTVANGFVEIRDFQTTGVVAFAKGLPFSKLQAGKQTINGHRVQVKQDYLTNSINSLETLVTPL
jgi:cellulose biosynthesis protein BcsQ